MNKEEINKEVNELIAIIEANGLNESEEKFAYPVCCRVAKILGKEEIVILSVFWRRES